MNGCTLALVPLEPAEALVVATVIPVVAVEVVIDAGSVVIPLATKD